MKASSFKLLDSSREVVTTKDGVLDPELIKPAVLGMRSSDIEADAAVENKVTTPKAVYDFVSGKSFLTEDELATAGIYPSSATAASADLNTMRTQGITLMQGNSVIQNGPLDAYPDGCLLRVYMTAVPGSMQIVQYLTVLDTCATYTRTGTEDTWSNWADPSILSDIPRVAFQSSDITVSSTGPDQNAAYLNLDKQYTVVGILDNEGVQWNLPSRAVTTDGDKTRVDISSVLTDKGITAAEVSGIWYVLLYFGNVRAKTIIADPVTEMAVADETWGDCRYLDATFRKLSFRGRVRNLRRVSLEMVSIDSGVTGNIVLVPIVNGSELSGTSFVVAVGAAPAVAEFALEVASGTLALRRDTDDERDTLKDSGNTPVTAVVLSVILEVQYDA